MAPFKLPAPPAWAARSKSRDVHVQKHHPTEETSPAYLHGSNAENRLVTLLWSQEGNALTDSFWQTLDSVPAASSCCSSTAGPSSLSVPSLGPGLVLVFHRWTWLICLDLFAVTPNEKTTRQLLSFSHFFVLFLIFLQSVWNGCLISQCCQTTILSASCEILWKCDYVSHSQRISQGKVSMHTLQMRNFEIIQYSSSPFLSFF